MDVVKMEEVACILKALFPVLPNRETSLARWRRSEKDIHKFVLISPLHLNIKSISHHNASLET